MIMTIFVDKQMCANCGTHIKSGDTCYVIEIAGREIIVCSITCGNLYLVGEYDDGG